MYHMSLMEKQSKVHSISDFGPYFWSYIILELDFTYTASCNLAN